MFPRIIPLPRTRQPTAPPSPPTTSPQATASPRQQPRRINFTVKAIEALPAPRAGRVYYHDSLVRGLCLCVTPTGAKIFYLYRWVDAKPVKIRIARFGEVPIERVRAMAGEKIGLIVQGINPQEQKIRARHEPTFGELFTAYLEKYKRPRRPKSAPQDQDNYDTHLSQWAERKLSEITRADVVALHNEIGEQHPYAANRILSLISVMYNQRSNVGISDTNPRTCLPIPNPTIGIHRFPEAKREKYLSPEMMAPFFTELGKLRYQTTADFFRIALFTGIRRSNIQEMRWEHVDLERGIWNIPDTKANRPQTVVLTEEALKVLRDRQKSAGASLWVFPSSKSETGHLVEPKTAWKCLMDRAGLAGFRIHDLRHTLASWMAAGGTSLVIIGKGLGHTQTSTTARYAHVDTNPIKAAMSVATAAIAKAAKKRPKKVKDK